MKATARADLRDAILNAALALDGQRGRLMTSAAVLTLQTAVTIAAVAALPSWLMGDRRAMTIQRADLLAAAQQLCIVWVVAAVVLVVLFLSQPGGGWRPRWCLAAAGRLLLMLVSLALPIGWWLAGALVVVHVTRYLAQAGGAWNEASHVRAVTT